MEFFSKPRTIRSDPHTHRQRETKVTPLAHPGKRSGQDQLPNTATLRRRRPTLTHPAAPRLTGSLLFQSAASADKASLQARPAGLPIPPSSPQARTNRAVNAGDSTIFKIVAQPIPLKFVWAVTKLYTNQITGRRSPLICWLLVLSICGTRGREKRTLTLLTRPNFRKPGHSTR